MSFGFLYYAHNNNSINYLKLAICSILSGKYHINNFNCAVVTDSGSLNSLSIDDRSILEKNSEIILNDNYHLKNDNFRNFYTSNYNSNVQPWFNKTRTNAFTDTIFDETIIVDVDYIFQDNCLQNLKNANNSIMMNKDFICILNDTQIKNSNFITKEKMGNFSIPMFWATVVYFKRDNFCNEFFELLNYIRSNYFYYQKLYQVDDNSYRNDYAFTIALHQMNGCMPINSEYEIPYKFVLATALDEVYRVDQSSTKFIVSTRDYNSPCNLLDVNGISYHCMNKFSLQIKYPQFLKAYYD